MIKIEQPIIRMIDESVDVMMKMMSSMDVEVSKGNLHGHPIHVLYYNIRNISKCAHLS